MIPLIKPIAGKFDFFSNMTDYRWGKVLARMSKGVTTGPEWEVYRSRSEQAGLISPEEN